jgi:acetoin utilization protein AcuB
MLVSDRMKKPVLTITPAIPIHEALNILKHEQIRPIPVLKGGKLVGIVTN